MSQMQGLMQYHQFSHSVVDVSDFLYHPGKKGYGVSYLRDYVRINHLIKILQNVYVRCSKLSENKSSQISSTFLSIPIII